VPLPNEEAVRLLDDLESSQQSIVRYQAVLKVRGEGPEGRFSATELVVFERPGRVRVELLATFGASRWIAVTDGGEITVLFPRSREYLQESAVEDVVSALLGIRLRPEEVMAILAGSGLPLGEATPARAERVGERVRVVLSGEPPDGPDERVDIERGQVREAVGSRYRVVYPTDWKQMGRTAPERIELANDQIEISLTVEDLDINVRLDPEAFTISIPEGAARLGVAEIGGEAVFVRPSQ
jgi:outer membrane lipoprotein-sorting protein